MYQLYVANKNYSSWSLRPWVLMRELKIPFEEKFQRFLPGGSIAAFRAFSPTGKVPTLHDGKTVVWDSLAIAEYLAERHDGVWPKDSVARAWARSAAAEMHSGFGSLREICSMNCGVRVRLYGMPEALKRDIARLSELWNDGLTRFGGPFLSGSAFGAVDAFFAPVAFRVQTYGLTLDAAASHYALRLRELPAMREWYVAGVAETFRDPEHDEVILKFGTIVEDLRVPAGT
ncbi:MAG: glutathione S-transferase family protein [Micropepsaceae bacterium]